MTVQFVRQHLIIINIIIIVGGLSPIIILMYIYTIREKVRSIGNLVHDSICKREILLLNKYQLPTVYFSCFY